MKTLCKTYNSLPHTEGRGWVILLLFLFTSMTLSAQTYLEHLQQNVQGLGSVSVTQSKEITDLVNGTLPPAPVAKPTNVADNTKEEKEKEEEKKEEPKERQALRPDMPKTDAEGTGEVEEIGRASCRERV